VTSEIILAYKGMLEGLKKPPANGI